MNMLTKTEAYVDMVVTVLPVSDGRTEQIRQATASDETMIELINTTVKRWPAHRNECQRQIQDSWQRRAELSAVNDIVFKGSKFVIPASLQRDAQGKCMWAI